MIQTSAAPTTAAVISELACASIANTVASPPALTVAIPPPPKQTSTAPTTLAGQRPNARHGRPDQAAKSRSAKNTGASTQITLYSGNERVSSVNAIVS